MFLRLRNKSVGKLTTESETNWTDVKMLLQVLDEKYFRVIFFINNEHEFNI